MITVGSMVDQHLPGADGLPSLEAEAAAHSLRAHPDASTSVIRAASPTELEVAGGPFRLLPAQRLLLAGDEHVRLGSRALEILIALVERPGERGHLPEAGRHSACHRARGGPHRRIRTTRARCAPP
jgi:DNA-binding response OmpR family regulator